MARDYCFTDFDTSDYDWVEFSNVKYICYGVEECPTTGKEHLQGFVCFTKTCRLPQAKRWIGRGDKLHFESRRGTRDQARDYCFKSGGKRWEWGIYENMTKEILFTKSKNFLLDNGYEEFYCRYFRAIAEKQYKGDAWRDVSVSWIWGEPDTGKTRSIMEKGDVYKWDSPYLWFDGYAGESRLLIDDYESGEISARVLKNVLDGYQYKLNIKGAYTYAQWTEVYFTSNYDITKLPEWNVKGIPRRIHEILRM